jgi:hypothetical protein
MPQDEIDIEVMAHDARNAALRADLENRGVDLQSPRSIELHFWSPNQRSAALLGKSLYDRGFLVLVLGPAVNAEGNRRWNLEVGANLPAERALDTAFTRDLVNLANQQSSEYDGWGTSV